MVNGCDPQLNFGDKSEQGLIPFSFTKIFNEHLPYYLAIGMTYEQYWDGDSEMVRYYRKANEIKNQHKNQELWMQGMYIYEAICNVVPVLVTFPDKHAKIHPYPSQPYPLTEKEAEQRKEAEEKKKKEILKANLVAWANEVNKAKEGK